MLTLKNYIDVEVIPNARYKILSIWKAFLEKGSANASLVFRVYYVNVRKKNFISKLIAFHYKNILIKRYNIYIHAQATIDIGLRFGHANGVIIGRGVNIGKNCMIYQQVTIGTKQYEENISLDSYPTLENNCILYAGCKVIGPIHLEQGTIVGANAVLLQDTQKNGIYGGIPARKLR
ncbi:MAG: hypothetical protein KH431_10425 [Erysipelotrichaceae bacterium]|nr:hypothetical protein [Erysipelotrichaceae bacterium]